MLKKNKPRIKAGDFKKKGGVSLIELLIVIAIIGVFAFLAMPYFRPFIRFAGLKQDGWKLLSDLRWYRQLAVVEHFRYKFAFDTAADTYSVEKRDSTTDTLLETVGTVSLNNDITTATDTTFTPKSEAIPASTITINEKGGKNKVKINVFSTTGLAKMVTN